MSISFKRAEDKDVPADKMLNGQLGMLVTGPKDGYYIYHVCNEYTKYWLIVDIRTKVCEILKDGPGWLVSLKPAGSKLVFTSTV
jgi:hypothetical protein